MDKIIIISPKDYIGNNIKDYLTGHLKGDILVERDLNILPNLPTKEKDLIIIVNESHQFTEEAINKLKNRVIVLTDLTTNMGGYNKNIIKLNFPIFLPDLLYNLQVLVYNSLNTQLFLTIPGYELNIDYGDAIVKEIKTNKNIKFTPYESRLLKILFKNYPNPVAKEHIRNLNSYNNDTSTLDTHILNIKNRLQHNNFAFTVEKNKQGYVLKVDTATA